MCAHKDTRTHEMARDIVARWRGYEWLHHDSARMAKARFSFFSFLIRFNPQSLYTRTIRNSNIVDGQIIHSNCWAKLIMHILPDLLLAELTLSLGVFYAETACPFVALLTRHNDTFQCISTLSIKRCVEKLKITFLMN